MEGGGATFPKPKVVRSTRAGGATFSWPIVGVTVPPGTVGC
jgi:hypothetical protein